MTDATRDGGPAFAAIAENRLQTGMSLRDYFASHAPITWQDAYEQCQQQGIKDITGAQVTRVLVQMRDLYAEEMLKVRES